MQRTAIILACFLFCTTSIAQQYPFVHYTPKDGLVNSRVKKSYQDSKGRMYFLTWAGLSVYDGARFRNYTVQNGLASNVINDILEVGKDSLLVATNSEFHLNVLINGKIGTLKTEGDTCRFPNQFYRHDDGRVYLSSDYGLFLMENNKITALNISDLTSTSPQPPYLASITGYGNFLLLTTNEMRSLKGLFLYDIAGNRICDALPGINAILLGKDKSNRIWISSHKLFVLDTAALKNGKISLTPPPGNYQLVKDYPVVNMAFDDESIWLVYRDQDYVNKDIRRLDESGSMSKLPLPEQITSSGVSSIMIDREYSIWLCNDGGVFKIVNSPLIIVELPFTMQKQIDRAFYSNGFTWFNNYSYVNIPNKLFRRTEKGFEEFTSNLARAPAIFHEEDNILLAYDDRNIYEAGFSAKKKTIDFKKIISLSAAGNVGKQLEVAGKSVIIAAQSSGLYIWKDKMPVFHLPTVKDDLIEGFAFDKNNYLWVVRRYTGADVFSLHPENISNYLQPVFHFTREQLTGSPRSFIIDKRGIIWIGTRYDGLIGYQHQETGLAKLFHFHTGNGLTDDFVTSLACDSMNNLIVGTQTGIDRIIINGQKEYVVENLSKTNNFFAYIKQCWADVNHAYALTNTGILLQVTNPGKMRLKNNPQLLLEEMKVNAKTLTTSKYFFRYKENNISFHVAAPSYLDEKQVTYSYLLEGSGNQQWSDTSFSNSLINLTNLSPGEYQLKVKAFFPSGMYPPASLSYSFEVTPPWWQTWWFRTLAGLLIIGLLIIGFRFYYRRKMERQMVILEKLKAIEKERTRIATDMHDDLGAGLSRIKFLSETIGIKKQQQQPVEEEVTKIREYSHEMIDKMGEIVWALNEKNDSLSDLLSYTRAYAMEYLSQNGISCKAELPDQLPSLFVSGEFRRNIFLTIKEALHNVVKHAQATQVTLTIHVNHQLSIRLKDNGIGFDRNNIRSFSNGLSNMQARIKEIGGKIEIINQQGTLINLSIPLKT